MRQAGWTTEGLRERFLLGFLVFAVSWVGLGCGKPGEVAEGIVVTLQPQIFLAKRLVGDRLECHVMVPPGRSPETYEPAPAQIASLAKARIYFAIGVPFERSFLPRVRANLPDLRVVDTTEGIEKRTIEEHSHAGHAHDHGDGESGHAGIDPHVWLNPLLMISIAERMRDTLREVYPEWNEEIEKKFASLEKDLESLDERVQSLLEPYRGRKVYVFHPAYGYFCDRYGLEQVPVESAGKEPSSKAFVKLVEQAKKEGVTTLFVQPQFSSGTVELFAREIEAEVVRIDPLDADYLSNIEGIARKMAASFEKPKTGEES